MYEMTSRERVREALEHREADRVPIDAIGTRTSGISAIAYNNLKKYFSIENGETKMFDISMQLADPEIGIINILGGDVVELHRCITKYGFSINEWRPWKLQDGSDCMVPYDFNPFENEKGDLEIRKEKTVVAKMPKGGFYFDTIAHPYENVNTEDDIDRISLPAEVTDKEIEYLKSEAKKLYEQTNFAIAGPFIGSVFEAAQQDWGYEKCFIEMALRPDLMHYYYNRLTEYYMKNLKKYLEAVGDYIDTIQFGDDLGTQENLQISVKMYREMIKPYHSRLFQYVQKKYPKVKVSFHSCGAIYKIIPDLIDAGVQVLNPIQLSAKGMDPQELKKEFGNSLVFWGGGCNMQTTATFGTIKDIQDEVKHLIKVFAPGGGFVFTQVHNIQANIPPEKIVAIYDTAKKFRKIYKD
jgi:uroporphyrinogen decarboxylase